MEAFENFGIKATLEEINSSVLFEFEVREAADPVNVANFKFGTLERHAPYSPASSSGAAADGAALGRANHSTVARIAT
jgi:hypothetical protein